MEGDYQQAEKDIVGRRFMAESDLDMWRDRAAWSQRMVKKGYLTASQAQSEQSRLDSRRSPWTRSTWRCKVLETSPMKRTRRTCRTRSTRPSGPWSASRSRRKAKEVQAEADRKAKKSVFDQEETRYQEIEEEIQKCTIISPQDGMVVYYVAGADPLRHRLAAVDRRPGRAGARGPEADAHPEPEQDAGQHPRPRGHGLAGRGEKCCGRPASATPSGRPAGRPSTPVAPVAQDAFAELRSDVRGAVPRAWRQRSRRPRPAGPVRIDAFPERALSGHVKTVATVASQQDWMSCRREGVPDDGGHRRDRRRPEARHERRGDDPHRRPRWSNVLTVPVQAIVGGAEMGKKRRCYVHDADGPEEREVAARPEQREDGRGQVAG